MLMTLNANVLGASVGTWADYRASVLTLANPGMAGHDTGDTFARVQDGVPAGMSYTASSRITTILSGGSPGNPRMIEEWNFNGGAININASHVVVRNCFNDLDPIVTTIGGGPFNMLTIAPGLTDVRVEYCTFSGRRGIDKTGDMVRLAGLPGTATDGSGTTYATDVIIRRNKFERMSGDAMKGHAGAGMIVEENWFASMYQYETGTRKWAAGLTFATNDYATHSGRVFRALLGPHSGNTPPTSATSNSFWQYVQPSPHSDYTQSAGGPEAIWRGNLFDATGGTAADALNNFLRFGNETVGGTGYCGPRRYLGNVMRRDQSAFGGTGPIYSMGFVNSGLTLGPYYFDGNEFHYSGAVIQGQNATHGPKLRFGPSNIGPGGVLVTGAANTGLYAGDAVPVFGALEM